MQTITRENAHTMIQNRNDVPVIETLSPEQYELFHLPGAKNVPLDDDFEDNIQEAAPEKTKPVLVYCLDEECEASSKAARKMEELGYKQVYDYEAGKADWKDAGLPVES